jgi:hypothetical protein
MLTQQSVSTQEPLLAGILAIGAPKPSKHQAGTLNHIAEDPTLSREIVGIPKQQKHGHPCCQCSCACWSDNNAASHVIFKDAGTMNSLHE